METSEEESRSGLEDGQPSQAAPGCYAGAGQGDAAGGAVVEKLAGRRYSCKQAANAAALFLIWLDNLGLVERKIAFKASLARPALMMLRA